MLFLIGKPVVGGRRLVERGLLDVRLRAPGCGAADDDGRVAHRGAVCRQRIGSLERQVAQLSLEGLLEPRLLMGVPGARQVPRGQPTAAAALTQTIGSFVAIGAVDGVTALP